LLTDVEWEFASRAGTTTPYFQGDAVPQGAADCAQCATQWDRTGTAPVAVFPANPLGLQDLQGNAWQWVEDCWHETYDGAPAADAAWVSGDCAQRVIRAGSFITNLRDLRSAMRFRQPPASRHYDVGFRLARDMAG
jgi:formylglycine-generating enzyme required for sulfatase activity